MNRRTAVLSALALPIALAGCARVRESRLNPFNWFGRSRRRATTATVSTAESTDGRQLIREVTELEVARMPNGAIVRASGLPPTQGWWDAELVADNRGRPDENGVLTYRFLVFRPVGQARVSTPQSRELTVARFLSNVDLQSISQIVVQGEANSRVSGR